MKKRKFILSLLSVFTLILVFALPHKARAMDYCDLIQYTVSEDHVVITGYSKRPEVLQLPSQIDGMPVTEIRENAFYKCDTLKKIIIPESVNSIGHHAFFKCTALEYAEIKGNIDQLNEGVFYECESLETVILNNSAHTVEDYAFFGCKSLSQFNIPTNVSSIGNYSFAGCESLNEAVINRQLKSIGSYAFYNCPSLKQINLPDNLMSIGKCAVGFSDNGKSDITITGTSESIAEAYAESCGIKFHNRIRYKNPDKIDLNVISYILTWLSFTAVYSLLMFVILKNSKKQKNRTA